MNFSVVNPLECINREELKNWIRQIHRRSDVDAVANEIITKCQANFKNDKTYLHDTLAKNERYFAVYAEKDGFNKFLLHVYEIMSLERPRDTDEFVVKFKFEGFKFQPVGSPNTLIRVEGRAIMHETVTRHLYNILTGANL